jgi:hypothetical protein
MSLDLPVVWNVNDATYAGGLQLTDDRVTLTSKSHTLSFSGVSIASLGIERSPSQRLRGLPVLRLLLEGGVDVRVASLGGAGSLNELAASIAARQALPAGT